MKKRLICSLTAALLLLSVVPAAWAAEAPADLNTVSTTMAALDIMVGDENGNLNLSANVTRSAFVKMAVAASPYGATVGDTTAVSPYPDVPYTNWAAPYVEAAVSAGYVNGYLDGTFRPNNNINLAEGVTIVLRLLGYQDSDFSGVYPSGQMAKYHSLGLDKGVSATSNTTPLTRQDTMYLFYNLLTAPTKNGQVYLTTLGHSLTASGEIDLVSLVNDAMEGPIVATSGWASQLGFTPNTVYRSGQASTLSAIQNNDVVYYSKSMRTVWAYTNKVSGVYQSASPSASNPTSITVAGKTYSIETASAAFALSSMGDHPVGSTVTLLLGRDGGVAAVASASSVSSLIYGVVTATGTGTFTDSQGSSYTSKTVTITATDGTEYTYPTTNNYTLGSLMSADASGSEVVLRGLASSALSGRVSADGTTLVNYTFAEDVEILDVANQTETLRIYPSRLAGVNLTNGKVRYYTLNSAGEISRMILDDVTGDMQQYGVLTSVNNLSYTDPSSNLGVMSGTYVYDIAGTSMTYHSDSVLFSVERGPCRVVLQNGQVHRIYNLTSVKLSAIDGGNAVTQSGTSYPLSDSVAAYIYADNRYSYCDLSYVTGGGYTLTAWYDKEPSSGGCVRVITAVPN